ncbi:flagellar basal body-associated FliL family protein [Seleniivibrio sp.]|uniref:flagellar basal body-associated FliL family protein n=1 Tax=Seleniivibrio sp. TaxID=2898801 RepID=UPI0025E5BFC7|nr:flagellar basal body-associated FliL family protein [Seleniivibrio sp.]MCD8552731.1 flagellar basal body-associated FliL family protein [Seleniivibrio sp.]
MKKFFQFILLILFVCLLAYMVYFLQGNLSFSIGDIGTRKNAFEDYKTETNFKDGIFRVELKDLVTSTGSGGKQYYRYDLSFETYDKASAKEIQKRKDRVAIIINSVMTSLTPDELNSEAERMRAKQLIAMKIEEYYPDIKIKDLYFTNYVYN